jgi:SAM-dependent methyltransferase
MSDGNSKDSSSDLPLEVYNELSECSLLFKLVDSSLVKWFGELSGKSLVEFGCGFGRNIKYFLDSGVSYCLGIDTNARMIEIGGHRVTSERSYSLQSQIGQNQPSAFIVEDCTKPFYRTYGQFDLAMCGWMIGRASNDRELRVVLQNLFNELKPGGRLALITDGFYSHSPEEQKIIADLFGFRQPLQNETDGGDPFLSDCQLYRASKSSNTGRPFTRDVAYTFKDYHWSKRKLAENLRAVGFEELENVPVVCPEGCCTTEERELLGKLTEPVIMIGARKPGGGQGVATTPHNPTEILRQPPYDEWSGV